uniref:Uncharacterized protein n=1 Tax=Anguilla anguilla TaxID=7936 RepID=A0A0E9W7J2_ANGAN
MYVGHSQPKSRFSCSEQFRRCKYIHLDCEIWIFRARLFPRFSLR